MFKTYVKVAIQEKGQISDCRPREYPELLFFAFTQTHLVSATTDHECEVILPSFEILTLLVLRII